MSAGFDILARSSEMAVLPRVASSPAEPCDLRALSVLHVLRYFRPDFTGEGIYLEKLAPLLTTRGIASEVVAEVTRPAGGAASLSGLGEPRLLGRGRRTSAMPYWPNLAMLTWFVRNVSRFDLVHFHSAVDRMFLLHAIARAAGCRVVQSSTLDDGLGSVVDGYRAAFRPMARRLCGLIDASVAISPRLCSDSARVAAAGRLHFVPQGVITPPLSSDGDRAAARARFGLAKDEVALLFVGGLCARKDVRFLLDQQAGLDRARARLLVIGPDLEDDYADGLRELAAQSGGRITLHGYMDDPGPAFRAADCFVFASRQEGFGNVLLEAMAHGLPVVSRRLEGVTDQFITSEQTGLLFNTAQEYRDAVCRLIDDEALRGRLGEAARQVVATQYSLTAAADRYAELYRSLV